jgi:hypothetical protein
MGNGPQSVLLSRLQIDWNIKERYMYDTKQEICRELECRNTYIPISIRETDAEFEVQCLI